MSNTTSIDEHDLGLATHACRNSALTIDIIIVVVAVVVVDVTITILLRNLGRSLHFFRLNYISSISNIYLKINYLVEIRI